MHMFKHDVWKENVTGKFRQDQNTEKGLWFPLQSLLILLKRLATPPHGLRHLTPAMTNSQIVMCIIPRPEQHMFHECSTWRQICSVSLTRWYSQLQVEAGSKHNVSLHHPNTCDAKQTWNNMTWCGGAAVRALDSWSRNHGFDFQLFHVHLWTMGKLLTHAHRCHRGV